MEKYKKRAFTMIELIFVIIAVGIIGSLAWQAQTKKEFNNNVNTFLSGVSNILNNGVMDINNGYINSTGGDCSSNSSYKDLTAARVVECLDWNTTHPYGGIKNTVGQDSYIHKLLKNYTTNAEGCRLYLKQNGTTEDEFLVFIDCSRLNYSQDPTKYKKYIEERLNSFVINTFSTIVKNTYPLATNVNNTSGGTATDGMIKFLLKK